MNRNYPNLLWNTASEPCRNRLFLQLLTVIILLVLAACLFLALPRNGIKPFPSAGSGSGSAFFKTDIEPILFATREANSEAAQRAEDRINEMFQRYLAGVEPFAGDLTSMGTRWQILKRMPGDWWNQDTRVLEYVSAKFAEHIFSEQSFEHDLAAILQELADELRANENRLLVQSRTALNNGAQFTIPDFADFGPRSRETIIAHATEQGADSVYRGLATLVASELAAVSAAKVATVIILNTTATTAAASATTLGGSAIAGGAAYGAAIGSPGGFVGITIGIGVGIAVSYFVDSFLTDRFTNEICDELAVHLWNIRSTIIDGDGRNLGVAAALEKLVFDLDATQSTLLYQSIVEEI